MSGNSKHSKNNSKIYVIILGEKCMWWMYGQYCFLSYSVNKSNDVEISHYYNILKTKAKLVVFLLFTLPQNSDGQPNL